MIDPIEFDRIESSIRVLENILPIDFWWLLVERGGEFLASCEEWRIWGIYSEFERGYRVFFWRMDKVEKYERIKKF